MPNRMSNIQAMTVLGMDPTLFAGSGGHNVLTREAVTAAFRTAILRNHPDHVGTDGTERASYINGAREVLLRTAV